MSLGLGGFGIDALLNMLTRLICWAKEVNVPVTHSAWSSAVRMAIASRASLSFSEVSAEILHFLHNIQCPVLGLFDELQGFLSPLGPDSRPDKAGHTPAARFLRDSFLKDLLFHGPPYVMWAITGTSMAFIWISIAEAAANGHELIDHCRPLHLPAVVGDGQMQLVWNQLVS